MALESNGVTQVPDGLGTAGKVLKVNSAGTAGEWGTINSDDLTEGSTNLFFTNARADARAQLKVDAIVGSAPGTLDTLNELAAALGDDANFSTTVTNSIATKLPLAGGTMTGDINFGDDNKAIFGAWNDLQIFHDSSVTESRFVNNNSNATVSFRSNGPVIQWWDTQYGGYYIHAARDGAVSLAYARATRLATTSTGIDVTGTALNLDGGGSNPLLKLKNNAIVYSTISHDTFNVQNNGLKLSINGTERMRIDTSGRVGIGTSSPATDLEVNGAILAKVHHEFFTVGTIASNIVGLDLNTGSSVVTVASPAANFSLAITNALNTGNTTTGLAIIVTQGSSPFIPNALTVNGSAVTINWLGGSASAGTASKTEIFSFTIINTGGVFTALGSVSTFG